MICMEIKSQRVSIESSCVLRGKRNLIIKPSQQFRMQNADDSYVHTCIVQERSKVDGQST